MLDSSRSAMTRNSSHLPSICGKDFLELVWENGQILAKGGSSSNNRTQNTPLYIGYSINEDVSTTKRARLNSSHQTNDQVFSQIDNNNSRMCTYSSQQQCLPSNTTPFKKPRIDSSSQTQKTNSQKQYLGCDQRTGKVNFSNFSIPAVFLKSSTNYHQNSARINGSSARVVEEKTELKGAVASSNSKERDHQSAVVESTKGSFQEQISLTAANKSNPAASSLAEKSVEPHKEPDHQSAVVESTKGSFQEQISSTAANKSNLAASSLAEKSVEPHSSEALREKGKANNSNLCNERASVSVCSLEASNNPSFSIRKHEDTDDSAYLSDDDDDEEEEENMIKEKAACEGNRLKRSRNAEIYNLSERKRRDKINEKIRTLKELIPNCNKVDKASMLDDAIDYLKTLKLQLEIMSMGRGLCTPFMMLPHQLMGGGMGLIRPGTGTPCSPTQFPIPPMPAGVTDNRLPQMFGFTNQMQIPSPMPIPNAPFIPMINGNSSTHGNHQQNLATHLANSGQLTTPDSRDLSPQELINTFMQMLNMQQSNQSSALTAPLI